MNFWRARSAERDARRGIAVLVGLWMTLGGVQAAAASVDDARSLAARGRPEEALRLVEEELLASPISAEPLFLQGVLLVELRRADEARDVFSRLIDLHPELPEPYNNLAVIQAADGDYDGAVETLRRSLGTNASYRTAYENLTKIFTQLASEAYSQALDPESLERPEVVELVLLGNLDTSSSAAPAVAAVASPEVAVAAPAAPAVETPQTDTLDQMTGEPEPAAAAVPPTADAPGADSVAPFVDLWRLAWQEQRVDDYLAAYSSEFQPADGRTRQEWEERRRERLIAPEFVRVTLAYLDEPALDGTTASIRFLQSYESDTFQDRVTKTLVLAWEEGGWKILEERAD